MPYTDSTDTIAALSTPPGIGALAVIRLSGNRAIAIAEEAFTGKKLSEAASHTLHFGTITGNGNKIDEAVAGIFKSPASYTGEDIVEITCHGSPFIQEQIIRLLLQKGARLARPGEFTLRAFLNGKMDLSQAEAVGDLIAAETQSAHDLAMKQMRGGYSERMQQLRSELIHFASLIELELDFSEEDVEFANRTQLISLIDEILSATDALITSFQLGNVMKNGVTTVIAGRPNAGKSTLLNALLNEDRAIVSDIAGTTRDTIEEELNINGIVYRLVDTAGIRQAQDEIEKYGVQRTMEKIKQASLLIYLFDVATMRPADVIGDVNTLIRDQMHLILAGNKIDAPGDNSYIKKFSALRPDIFISSTQKTNIDALKDIMYKKIISGDVRPGNILVSNTRHLEALQKSKEALRDAKNGILAKISGEFISIDIRRALDYLGQITGEVTTDDLLGNIFGNFCIGK